MLQIETALLTCRHVTYDRVSRVSEWVSVEYSECVVVVVETTVWWVVVVHHWNMIMMKKKTDELRLTRLMMLLLGIIVLTVSSSKQILFIQLTVHVFTVTIHDRSDSVQHQSADSCALTRTRSASLFLSFSDVLTHSLSLSLHLIPVCSSILLVPSCKQNHCSLAF